MAQRNSKPKKKAQSLVLDMPQLHLSFLNERPIRTRGFTNPGATAPHNISNHTNPLRTGPYSRPHSNDAAAMSSTPYSILNVESINRQGVTQFKAIKDAEKWFTRATTLLEERLLLAKELKSDFGELIKYLNQLSARSKSDNGQDRDIMDIDENETVDDGVQVEDDDEKSDTSSVNIIVDDYITTPTTPDDLLPGLSQLNVQDASILSPGQTDGMNEANLTPSQIEQRAIEYIRSIRVLRAKWHAGGRGFERWTGTR